jgi:hypothetical protein
MTKSEFGRGEYLVRSDKSGSEAVRRPEALRRQRD